MKHWEWGYHLLWRTQKPNMRQLMKICGHKLTHLWKKVHWTDPCTHLEPLKRKSNLDLSLLNLSPFFPQISFIISSQNPWKISFILLQWKPRNTFLPSNSSIIKTPFREIGVQNLPKLTKNQNSRSFAIKNRS